MYASTDASAQGVPTLRPWLLFMHQVPPSPDYLRVKVRRRLRRLGAAALKQTVYLLPNTPESLEDFQWLRQEIEADGGSAIIADATFVEGISDEELHAMLDAERGDVAPDADAPAGADHVEPGQTWVTREGVGVDRMSSAWLIRRFIDPRARFRFVAARGSKPRAGELRFDIVGGEYTHEGADCTFQTLTRRFGLRDRALTAVGEVVHDIDCKDGLFARPETAGIAGLVRSISRAELTDAERLERGGALFEDLYSHFRSVRRQAPRAVEADE